MFRKVLSMVEEYTLAVCMVIMTILTFLNVVTRYGLNISMAFTEEITTNLLFFCSFLGAAVAARDGSHLGLSILTDLLPARFQKYVSLFTVILALFYCGLAIYLGTLMVQEQTKLNQTTPALGWPEWVFGALLPIGVLFMVLEYIVIGVNALSAKENK